ncbi:PEP-CTERM sorting domain-containing protein [Verrucomicrobiaceae bacterium 227]
MKRSTPFQTPLALAALAIVTTSASAVTVLEEQFDYETGPVSGNDGGLGFAGPWTVTGWNRDYDVNSQYAPGVAGSTTDANGGLTFPGLPTAGSALSRFGTAGQRAVARTPLASSLTALTADNSTIWFSVLVGGPAANSYGTLIFGTDPLAAQQTGGTFPNGNMDAASGQGFGITLRNAANGSGTGSPNAIAFINSDAPTVNEGSFLPALQAGGTHRDTALIVGKINWNANGTADELFLFNIDAVGGAEPLEGDAIASLTADFDQSNFDTISLWDTGATIYDEIRFGNDFVDVTGVPEPSAIALLAFSSLALLKRRRK